MGKKAKQRREAADKARIEAAKALLPEAVGAAAAMQMCFCGGTRHPYGSRPVAAVEYDAVREADKAKVKHSFSPAGRTHGCPLRAGHQP